MILAQLILHGGASVTVAAPSEFKLDLARSFGITRRSSPTAPMPAPPPPRPRPRSGRVRHRGRRHGLGRGDRAGDPAGQDRGTVLVYG
jgi:hypothetical protein